MSSRPPLPRTRRSIRTHAVLCCAAAATLACAGLFTTANPRKKAAAQTSPHPAVITAATTAAAPAPVDVALLQARFAGVLNDTVAFEKETIAHQAKPAPGEEPSQPGTPAEAMRPSHSAHATHTADGRPIIYFTFDDGPSTYTPRVLDILRKHHGHATFFMIGSSAQSDPAMVARVKSEGHGVGNHTWHHAQLNKKSESQIREEIARGDSAIGGSTCVRPPYGATNKRVNRVLAEEGKSTVLWTIDTEDWKQPGTESIVGAIVKDAHPGDVVLMHDGGGSREQSVAALEQAMDRLESKGYAFERLPECR